MSNQSIVKTIAVGDVANLGPAHGQALQVTKGFAWVTQGDERDLIIEAGDHVILDGPGEVLVTALNGAVAYKVEGAHVNALAA